MVTLAIVSWGADDRVTKYQDYQTEVEAAAHVTRVKDSFPNAFVTPHPGGGFRDWLVDPVAKTVSVVPPPLVLAELKSAKRADFIAEGVTRIAAQVPDWDSLDTIKTVAGLWTSHLAANATVAQTVAKDIYLYARDTVPAKLAAVTTQAELDAIDPTAADAFGDGTPWPT